MSIPDDASRLPSAGSPNPDAGSAVAGAGGAAAATGAGEAAAGTVAGEGLAGTNPRVAPAATGASEAPEEHLPGVAPDAVPMPAARVRMTPIALSGLALWLIGLVLVLVLDFGDLARDIAIVGAGLGVVALAWALYTDRRRHVSW